MDAVHLALEPELAVLLQDLNQPIQDAARELITLELYRRAAISSGRAAQLLGMTRWEFVRHAARLGIPFFDMSDDEWERERAQASKL